MWGLHFQVTGQEPRQELEAETIENMLLGYLVKLRAAAQAMRPPTAGRSYVNQQPRQTPTDVIH